ncbi:uncharacterized protein LOC142320138 isoform X2 [Lycorma delicatula]|uniref:uncharacterized protein LOC142320138 isoform X2 n=1 Tax=Lycorma delicatula TaxID=130591 RepID=UPI003F50E84C
MTNTVTDVDWQFGGLLLIHEQLKVNIEQALLNIQPQTLKKVARNAVKRIEACIQEDGGHFQHLL